MKRIAWILACLILAIGGLLVLLVTLLPRDTLKTRIGEQIAAWTGRDVSLRGEPEIDLFPRLMVTLRDVEVGGPDGMENAQIIAMEELRGSIRLLPLVIGRVEIGSFTIVRPLVHLVRDEAGNRNWAFDAGAAALQLAFAGDVPLGDFVVEEGALTLEDRGTGRTERLNAVNVNVEWDSVRQPLSVRGSGIWRGEQVILSATARTPFNFLNGEATPVEGRLDSLPISIVFEGEARNFADPVLTGGLTMSTPSLRGFAAWLGSPIQPGSTLGAAGLAGGAVYRADGLFVENAEFTLDGNRATGALHIVPAVTPSISGTLAFPVLDLTPYFAGLSARFASGSDWRAIGFQTEWFADLLADVRLSAESVQIGQTVFTDTAASVSLREGRLEIGLAQAGFAGGSLAGAVALADAAEAPTVTAALQLRAAELDLAVAGPALGLPAGVAGRGSLDTNLAGEGRNLGTLVNSLSGAVDASVLEGAVPLFGLEGLADAAGPGAAPPEPSPVPVQDFAVRASLGNGVAVVEELRAAAPEFSARGTGRISLADGRLALEGTVRPLAPGARPVPFAIGGSLARPDARPVAAVR